MHTRTSSVLLAAGLSTVAAAQAQPSFETPRLLALPGPEPEWSLGAAGARALRPPSSLAELELRRLPARAQEPDYSLHGLFMQAHGEFMLKRERYDPDIELAVQVIPGAEIQGDAGHFDLVRGEVDAEIKVMIATDAYLEVGGFYEHRNYHTSNMAGFPSTDYYSAGLKLGFGAFLDESMLLEGMVAPGTWSDWDGTLHSEDFDMPASLLLTIRSDTDLFFRVGVRYNEIFEEANVLPYLGLGWQFHEQWRLDLLLPEQAEISFWPSPELGLLLGAEIQGAEYHVRSSAATGNLEANARVQEFMTYLGAQWRLNDNLSFGGRLGVVVAGDYKPDDGDPATPDLRGQLEPAFFAELSVGWSF
jgi:hypothetical protein